MKHIYSLLLLACILITACKKDNAPAKPQDDAKKYQVKFNATAFSQEFTDYKNNALQKGLKVNAAVIDTNYYAIDLYILDDKDNIVYSKGTTDNVGGNLGQFSFALPAGTYKAIFTGMYEYFYKLGDRYSSSRSVIFNKETDYYYVTAEYFHTGESYENINTEVFFKEIPLNVPQTNQTQNVSLKRITSRLRVNIKDFIPAQASSLVVTYGTVYRRYSIGPTTYLDPIEEAGSSVDLNNVGQIGNATYDFDILVPPNSNHTVTIKAYNKQQLLAQKVITNVVLNPNQITLLRGNLFGGTGSGNTSGTHVKADTTWNSTVINKSF